MQIAKTEFNDIFVKLLNGEVDSPDLLSKYVIQLSAHLFNLAQKVTEKEVIYAKLWEQERGKYKTDKATDTVLKASNEWQEQESAKNAYRTAKELIMAAKKRLNVLSDLARMNY